MQFKGFPDAHKKRKLSKIDFKKSANVVQNGMHIDSMFQDFPENFTGVLFQKAESQKCICGSLWGLLIHHTSVGSKSAFEFPPSILCNNLSKHSFKKDIVYFFDQKTNLNKLTKMYFKNHTHIQLLIHMQILDIFQMYCK